MNNPAESPPAERPVVLITGVSGLIGTRVAEVLTPDYRIVGLDVQPPQHVKAPVQFIETDLTDDGSTAEALQKVSQQFDDRIASVVHLAAYYDFKGEPSPLYQDLTVEGTRRMLRGLQSFQVEQFVFSSTLLVMKPDDEKKHLSEFSDTRAEWAYPQSKLDAEQVIHETHGNIPYVVLRIAGVYDEDCHSIPIAQQISRIYERRLESFMFPGDPSHGQAFVHLDDLATCFRRTVDCRKQLRPEEMFLIAEPDVMSYEELQNQIGELIHGEEWPTIRIPKAFAKAGAYVKNKFSSGEGGQFIKPWMIDLADDHYDANISHARHQLGWNPEHRLRDALPQMIGLLKQSPQGWYEINGLPVPEDVTAS